MDVESTAERIIPTTNFVKVIHPNMPTENDVAQLDGSVDFRKTFEVAHEPNDLVSKSPIEFIIHPTPNHYVDLQSFVLDVKLQITLSDGTRAAEVVAAWYAHFINNLTQSLWSVIKIYLNDVCVQSNYNNQQAGNLLNILTTPETLIKERGEVQGCWPVTDTSLIDVITNNHCADTNVAARIETGRQATVHVKGPIMLDLSTCEKYLIDGVSVKLVFEPSSIPYLIKSSAAGGAQSYDYKLLSVKLECTKVKPSDGAILTMRKMIAKEPIEYLMKRMIIHREIVPQGYIEYVSTRPFQNLIPNKLYIFLVDRDSAVGGDQQRYPFYYDHCGLKHYSVKINGFQIAGGPTDSDYKSEYLNSLSAHGGDYFIPFKNYTKGCFVLCVNTNDQSEYNSLNIEKSGNLTITLTFNAALARPRLLHIAGTIDSPFSVDLDRNITTDFQH